MVCESPVDNFPVGINGFCEAIGAVVAESKLSGDFQVLKGWRLPAQFTADEEAARLIWWTQRMLSAHLPMKQSDALQGKHTIDVGRFYWSEKETTVSHEQGTSTEH